METIEVAGKAAQQLAAKDDRYLFLFSLIIGGVAIFWAFRYILNRLETLDSKRDAERADRDKKQEEHNTKNLEVMQSLAVTIDRNNEVLGKVLGVLEKVHDRIGDCPARLNERNS